MRIVVARIDRPGGAGARMRRLDDPVERRIAHVDVAGRHVDLGAQHAGAVFKLAGLHAAEQVEVLLDAAVAERAVPAGLGQRAARDPHRLRRLVVDIGLAGFDEQFGPFIQPVEIVGGVIEVLAPIEAQPAHVALDGVDVFLLLLGRVGVVETQVAAPAELLGDAEIQADRLGVADVEIAVRLGREPGHHRGVLFGVEVRLNDVADEIAPAFVWCFRRNRHIQFTMPDSGPRRCAARLVPNPRRDAKSKAQVPSLRPQTPDMATRMHCIKIRDYFGSGPSVRVPTLRDI